jgi:hypothetical protein
MQNFMLSTTLNQVGREIIVIGVMIVSTMQPLTTAPEALENTESDTANLASTSSLAVFCIELLSIRMLDTQAHFSQKSRVFMVFIMLIRAISTWIF